MRKTPMLSTAFTNSGNKAKYRFSNILNINKRRNVILPIFIIIGIVILEVLISCTADSIEKIETEISYSSLAHTATISAETVIYNDKTLFFEKGKLDPKDELTVYYLDDKVCYIANSLGVGGYVDRNAVTLVNSYIYEHNASSIYPIVYDYFQKQLAKCMEDEYDNCYIKSIGTKGQPLVYNEENDEYEYKCNIKIIYTQKTEDEKTLEYIKNAFESGDENSFTYYDGEELFNHGNIRELIMNFKLNGSNIDESSVSIKQNKGQIVHTMPIQDPAENWVDIKSFAELLEDMGRITYSKDLVEKDKINYIN